MKKFTKISLLIIVMPVIACLMGIAHNNFGDNKYSRADLTQAFNHSIQWLQQNNLKVLNDNNLMLWWMLMRAGDIRSLAKIS